MIANKICAVLLSLCLPMLVSGQTSVSPKTTILPGTTIVSPSSAVAFALKFNSGAGTISVTNGSKTITGTSTAFSTTAMTHGIIKVLGTGGVTQGLASCTSTTACTFLNNYTGTTNGTASYSIAQVCFPTVSTTNTCTFPANISTGDIVTSIAIVNTDAATSFTLKDGSGNSLTLPTNGSGAGTVQAGQCRPTAPTYTAWIGYFLSAPSATSTIVFTPTPAATVSAIWSAEYTITGGSASLDSTSVTCAFSSTTTNPSATMSLASSGELGVFAVYMDGAYTAAASPWTTEMIDSSTGLLYADYNPTSGASVTMGNGTPTGQGTGVAVGLAIQ